ncbi:Methylmalonate-semialdehyde dehydrogenase of acylating [Spatholobus suberectus]|nr:Methylmalonate-semialdehyde dehydrogenase of acylating [Spatholobus suberectus]
MTDVQSSTELNETAHMLAPPPGTFVDREELIQHVGDFAVSQGYVVTIKQSKRDKVVVLGCDRGGVYRNRRKPAEESSVEHNRKRKTGSRLTNCPFEAVGKKEDGLWVLTIKNGTHNHEPLKDMSEHPSARRFTEREVLLIKEMTEAGLKPRQILKRLRQSNPELLSTPKHVYNVKAKLRQGNTNVRNFKSLRPEKSAVRNNYLAVIEPLWRQCNPPRVPNLIGGRFVDSQSCASIDILNPASQQVVSQVPMTTNEEFKAAVFSAKRAFSLWHNTPVSTRQRIMFKFQELIDRDIDKIAMNISTEHGKTLRDARDGVLRGLEVVEHACGMGNVLKGYFVPDVYNGIDTHSIRESLGVCADVSYCCHMWQYIHSKAIREESRFLLYFFSYLCGVIWRISYPLLYFWASVMLAELAIEAGLPNGVLNIVHGTNDIVNAICDDDDIKAVSFVGSNTVGAYVYARASTKGKRVQSNIGAKNHAVIMPDARVDATLKALVTAGFGAAGQKCTALSAVVFVGSFSQWKDKLVEHAKSLKVNAGTEPDTDLGPVISKQAKEHTCRLIQTGVESGAKLVLDGRNIVVPGYKHGNFIGPTILSDVTVDMRCYKEEILGPVLLCMEVDSIQKAINIVNSNKYGNGASIFTTSNAAARKFQTEVEVGQVGINVPISVSLPFSSFISSRPSFVGDLNFDGRAGIQFYTQIKMVTKQWTDSLDGDEATLEMPFA